MAEYIKCRNCESPDCKGCNLKNLETMLNNGKFDCLMNENRCVNPSTDVAPVRHGRWVKSKEHIYLGDCVCREWTNYFCPICDVPNDYPVNYCPNCGAKMVNADE